MDVNDKTRRSVVSVLFAGTDVMGLWTVNLDGTGLKQLLRPEWGQRLTGVDHPTWTPDGKWIAFEERMRGMNPQRFNIAICDDNGGHLKRLFEATEKIEYRQPSVSPDGNQIAFVRYPNGYPGGRHIWLSNIDGSDAHALPNPNDKTSTHGGDYPTWSPDGKKILYKGVSGQIVDATTAQKVVSGSPQLDGKRGTFGWPHWGRLGIIGFNVGGILYTDPQLHEAKWLAGSHLVECSGKTREACRW
jgi:Tol biopolymer transport system component